MQSAARPRARGPFAVLTAAVSAGTAVFFSLYSLIPVTRADEPELGSLFLGTMMAFVMGVQPCSPLLVRRFSLRGVLAAALLLLAAGSLTTGLAEGVAPLLLGAVASGLGFGALIVVGTQGVALVVPREGLGRALGVYGLVTVSASAVGSPAGVQLALAFSTARFGVCAAVLCAAAAAVSLALPGGAGREAGGGAVRAAGGGAGIERAVGSGTVGSGAVGSGAVGSGTVGSGAAGSGAVGSGAVASGAAGARDRGVRRPGSGSTPGAARTAIAGIPWLALALLLFAVLLLSHGLVSFPVVVGGFGSAATAIFCVQGGNAIGRWLGSALSGACSAGGAALAGAALMVGGAAGSVLAPAFSAGTVWGVALGVGVGVAQTVTLHAVLRRTEAGRGSVLWNLSVDGGLWLGGVLWGLALSGGFAAGGVLAVSSAVAAWTVAFALRGRRSSP